MTSLSLNQVQSKEVFMYPAKILSVGMDLSQFTYMVGREKLTFNFAGSVQYKPLYFLTFNSVLGFNNTNEQRGEGYQNLYHYNSKGAFAKIGFDVSLGISRRYQNKRIFLGYQLGFIRFSESGEFVKQNEYWSDFKYPYLRQADNYSAGEIVFGYQWISRRWGIRIQGYEMSIKSDTRISNNDQIVHGYRTPFIPGYGFRRGGVNMILLYRLGNN